MNSLSPDAITAPDTAHDSLFAAIELSRSQWLVVVSIPPSAKISRWPIPAGDAAGPIAHLKRLQTKLADTTGRPVDVIPCYEAGYDGFWLHRRLAAEGICNYVLDAASLLINRKARRAKTDRLDAESLVRTITAFHRGDRSVCRIVPVPSLKEEDAKRLHREREQLIRERVRYINRIKGLLATHGIHHFKPIRRDWAAQLAALRTADGHDLPDRMRAEVGRICQRLALVTEMIKSVDAERDALIASPKPTGSAPQKAAQLVRLRGIGPQVATVLAHEVFYRRFGNRRELGSYLGLTPSPYSSGAVHRSQGISKAGNARARATAIELAWLWLRYQPQSALAGWFRHYVGEHRGRVKKIAIVALARKLVVALWRYLEAGVVPGGAELKPM